MQPLENVIEEVVNSLRSVSGLKSVPINPPENVSYDTFGIVYPFTGSVQIGPVGTMRFLHSIAIDILTKRSDLARDIGRIKPLIDLVSNKLISEVTHGGTFFNNTLKTYESLTYVYIPLSEYAGEEVIGYHFVMNGVKILV